jgi:glyoxylase-like metal-dependent hydrolase (beta-lactamase superfamily II)
MTQIELGVFVMRNKIITITGFILILALAGLCRAAGVEELSPHVSVCQDSVNGVFIRRQGRTLVIYGDPCKKLKKADKVLFTHSRRDVAWAGRALLESGAKSVVPLNEVDKFEKAGEFWSAFVKNRYHDYEQQTTKVLTEPLRVDQAVRGGDIITWQGLAVRVLDTPGYSRDSVSYFVDVDGTRYGFVGDLIYGNGHLMDLYSLQNAVPDARIGGYHGYAGRLGDLISSLREVLKQNPDILVPARGPVIESPKPAVNHLIRRLQAAYKNYLSINAGHWYFKERYETLAARVLDADSQVDWMPYALVVKEAPPNWIIPIRNSRLLVSKDGSGFLIDCGSKAIIDEVTKLMKEGQLSRLDGIFITHYHDDHTDKVAESVAQFGCPVYSCRELADILERPEAYRLPAMTANRIVNLTHLPDGHKMRWKEFDLTSYYFPGQTIYHGALLVEKDDGQAIFFIGDSFTPSGIDDYCLQNRNLLHKGMGYFYCLDLIRKMPPNHLLVNQHVVEPFRFGKDQLEHIEAVLEKRKEIMAGLFPWDEPNYGIDERWARIYPYGQKARPGQSLGIAVKILNHSNSSRIFTVRPNVPEGFHLEPQTASASIESRKEAEIRFKITVPEHASKSVYVITTDVEFGKWDLRQWCECMVEIDESDDTGP